MKTFGVGARSILANASYLFGSHVATMLFRGAYVVVLARTLGPEDFGVLNYGLAWYLLFISLTYLGLDTYLVQRVGADRAAADVVLHQTLCIRAAAAAIVACGSAVIALFVEPDPYLRRLIGIFSIALVGRTIWLWAVSAFTAFERTHFALRSEMLFRPVEIGAALAILAIWPQLHLLAAMHAILWGAQGGLGLYTVTRQLTRLHSRTSLRGSMELLARAFPAGIYPIIVSVFMQAPIVIMKLVESDQFRLGQFVLAYQACVYFLVVPYLFSTVMLPVLSRAAARGDGLDVGHVGVLVRVTCVAGAAALIVVGPSIPAITEKLFGAEYRRAGDLLRLALWLVIPFSAVTMLLQLFFARRAYAPISIYGALGAAIMAASIPQADSIAPQVGPLVVTGAGLSVWLVAMLLATSRYVPTYERRRSLGACASAAAAAATYPLTAGLVPWLQMGATLAVLAAVTAALRSIDGADLRLLTNVMSEVVGFRRS